MHAPWYQSQMHLKLHTLADGRAGPTIATIMPRCSTSATPVARRPPRVIGQCCTPASTDRSTVSCTEAHIAVAHGQETSHWARATWGDSQQGDPLELTGGVHPQTILVLVEGGGRQK